MPISVTVEQQRQIGGREFGRKFPKGGLDFLEVALVWTFPYEMLPKQTLGVIIQGPFWGQNKALSSQFEDTFKPPQATLSPLKPR